MAKPQTGTAFNISGSNMPQNEYQEYLVNIRKAVKTFREAGHRLAVEGSFGDNSIRVISDIKKESAEAAKLNAYLEAIASRRESGTSISMQDVDLKVSNHHMRSGKSLKGLAALGETSAMDVRHDSSSNTVSLMYEAGRKDLTRKAAGYIGRDHQAEREEKAFKELHSSVFKNKSINELQQYEAAVQDHIIKHPNSAFGHEYLARIQNITNRKQKAELLEAERTSGTPEFEAAISRRLGRRVATEDAQLAWAKKNKHLPMARALARSIKRRRRNSTAGGRALNRAASFAKATALGAVVSAIGSSVVAMVKFLSQLPAIASNVQKLAVSAVKYNVPREVLERYEKFGEKLADGNGMDMFTSFLGSIHTKLADIMGEDIVGAISFMAGLSSKVGGRHTNSAIRYFKGETHDITEVMEDAISDVAKATFLEVTLMERAAGTDDAASRNRRPLENTYDEGAGSLWMELYEKWRNTIDESDRVRIRQEVVENNGNFVQLMAATLGVPLTMTAVSGATAAEEGRHVAQRFKEFKADAKAINDGILQSVLAKLDPIIDTLRQILRGILGLAANVGVAGAAEALFNFNTDAAGKNAVNMELNRNTLDFARRQLTRMMGDRGIEDDQLRNVYDDIRQGRMPRYTNGRQMFETQREALEFAAAYTVFNDAMAQEVEYVGANKEKYERGELDVRDNRPSRYGAAAQKVVDKANRAFMENVSKVIERVGTDPERLASIQEELDFRIDEAERDALMLAGLEGRSRQEYLENHSKYGTAGGYKDRILDDKYKSPEDHLIDLLAYQSAISEVQATVAHIPGVSNKTASYNYQKNAVKLTNIIPEAQEALIAVKAEIADRFSPGRMSTYNRDGAVLVQIGLTNDEQNRYVVFVDREGNELGGYHTTSTIAERHVLRGNVYEAPFTDYLERLTSED